MKTTAEFIAAKKDKNLTALVIIQRTENNINRTYMRLCIESKNKYTGARDLFFIESDTNIKVYNYSNSDEKKHINEICFHISNYGFIGSQYLKTFLGAIKPNSEVNFQVTAYNSSDAMKEVNFINHYIVGIVDGKEYLLNSYVGKQNLASPVQ